MSYLHADMTQYSAAPLPERGENVSNQVTFTKWPARKLRYTQFPHYLLATA